MIRSLFCLLVVSLFFSCQEQKEELVSRTNIRAYNRVLVVVSDSLWRNHVGDSIRQYLASNVEGITPIEPIFTLDQLSESLFVGKEKQQKNIILFREKSNENSFKLEEDKYSMAQNYFEIEGSSDLELISIFKQNIDSIVNVIHDFEIEEIHKNLDRGKTYKGKYLKERFSISLNMPIEYKRVVKDNDIVWYKMDIASGNSNILVYEAPFTTINYSTDDQKVLEELLKHKDSIVSKYIHSAEVGSFMKVDGDFMTFNKKIMLAGMPTYELKGSWDMANSFMDGPFICYVVLDTKNERYLFIEGFTYNPSMNKRDVLLELEAIIKTVRFL